MTKFQERLLQIGGVVVLVGVYWLATGPMKAQGVELAMVGSWLAGVLGVKRPGDVSGAEARQMRESVAPKDGGQ